MAKAPRAPKGRGKGKSAAPAAKKPLPKKQPARPRPSGGGGKAYEIVCSECYTSFAIPQNVSASAITCPECLHVGTSGAKDVMSKIAIAKTAEQGNFMKALIPAILFVVAGIIWGIMLTSAAIDGQGLGAGTNYGFLGGTAILFILAVGLGFKYEGNRYEVYF